MTVGVMEQLLPEMMTSAPNDWLVTVCDWQRICFQTSPNLFLLVIPWVERLQ